MYICIHSESESIDYHTSPLPPLPLLSPPSPSLPLLQGPYLQHYLCLNRALSHSFRALGVAYSELQNITATMHEPPPHWVQLMPIRPQIPGVNAPPVQVHTQTTHCLSHTYSNTHTHTHTHSYTCTHTQIHMHTRTHTLTHTHTHTCTQAHKHTHTHMHTNTHRHTQTHTDTHKHTHTCTHAHILLQPDSHFSGLLSTACDPTGTCQCSLRQ